MYLAIVCVAGVLGYLMGTVVRNPEQPAYLFLVQFPATPSGIAAYGALTVATVLGVPLALVALVSRSVGERVPEGKR